MLPHRPPGPVIALAVVLLGAIGILGLVALDRPSSRAVVDDEAAAVRAPLGDGVDFSQVTVTRGALRSASTHYDRGPAYEARYCGGPGNGYARGVLHVDWPAGATRSYGVALLLPTTFADDQQGEVDLLRWDNFTLYGEGAEFGGVVLFDGDGLAHLERGRYSGATDQLGEPFALPRGRWFWLEVRQRLSAGDDATSTVRIDGRIVSSSREPNAYGRPIRRVRYGLVAIDERTQVRPLSLTLSRPSAGPDQTGPGPLDGRDGASALIRRTPTPERVASRCAR